MKYRYKLQPLLPKSSFSPQNPFLSPFMLWASLSCGQDNENTRNQSVTAKDNENAPKEEVAQFHHREPPWTFSSPSHNWKFYVLVISKDFCTNIYSSSCVHFASELLGRRGYSLWRYFIIFASSLCKWTQGFIISFLSFFFLEIYEKYMTTPWAR